MRAGDRREERRRVVGHVRTAAVNPTTRCSFAVGGRGQVIGRKGICRKTGRANASWKTTLRLKSATAPNSEFLESRELMVTTDREKSRRRPVESIEYQPPSQDPTGEPKSGEAVSEPHFGENDARSKEDSM